MKNLLKNLWSVLTYPFVSLYMYFAGGKSSAPVVTTSGDAVVTTSGDEVVAFSNQQNKESDDPNNLLQKNLAENKPKAIKYTIMAGCVAVFLGAAFAGSSESTSPMPFMVK